MPDRREWRCQRIDGLLKTTSEEGRRARRTREERKEKATGRDGLGFSTNQEGMLQSLLCCHPRAGIDVEAAVEEVPDRMFLLHLQPVLASRMRAQGA